MAIEMDEREYRETRQRSFDEYLREQDQDLERRQLLFIHSYGAWEAEDSE